MSVNPEMSLLPDLCIKNRKPTRFLLMIFYIIAAFMISGCHVQLFKGLIYTRITIPLTRNLHPTPCTATSGTRGNIVTIKEPFTGYGIYTEMHSNAIGDIAEQHGLRKVYFADQEIRSYLGIWTVSTVYVYGE